MPAAVDTDAAAVLERTHDVLHNVQMIFLSGRAQPKEQLQLDLWGLFAKVVATLAVLQDETVREICEGGFSFSPSDEEWRNELLPRLRAAAGEV